jgi:ABC-type sulfate/molybdate transport systems ATPase subunit
VLLLDEPLNALDEGTRDRMCELLRTVQKQSGVATLHVTHSRVEARHLADKLLVLWDGRLEERPLAELDKLPADEQAAPQSPLIDRRTLAAGNPPK